MMTGALIALVVKKPELALPLAFASHFLVDILPHYGYGEIDRRQRDGKKHFILKQTIDIYFALFLMWVVPYLSRDVEPPLWTELCMLVAFIPDAVWALHYVVAQRTGIYRELNAFNRFHKAIQWCERSWGVYVEAMWFVILALSMYLVAT